MGFITRIALASELWAPFCSPIYFYIVRKKMFGVHWRHCFEDVYQRYSFPTNGNIKKIKTFRFDEHKILLKKVLVATSERVTWKEFPMMYAIWTWGQLVFFFLSMAVADGHNSIQNVKEIYGFAFFSLVWLDFFIFNSLLNQNRQYKWAHASPNSCYHID